VRGAVMYGPGDVRVEERPDPQIRKATDAIIRLSATCICGSDRRVSRFLRQEFQGFID
jgi:threonine dehydrogenase-like Zn-dependent dehydrogenase